MNDKDPYERKMQAQIEEWRAGVDKLEAQAKGAAADAQLQLNEKIETLQGKIEEGNSKLTALRAKGEEAWEKLAE